MPAAKYPHLRSVIEWVACIVVVVGAYQFGVWRGYERANKAWAVAIERSICITFPDFDVCRKGE